MHKAALIIDSKLGLLVTIECKKNTIRADTQVCPYNKVTCIFLIQ